MVQPGRTFMPAMAWPLTSGITRGTPSVMRNADELSTTVQPASDAMGAYFLEMPPPAEKSAMSQSPKLRRRDSLSAQIRPRCQRSFGLAVSVRADETAAHSVVHRAHRGCAAAAIRSSGGAGVRSSGAAA